LAHWCLVGLPEDFIQMEGAYSFFYEVKGLEVKPHLFMSRKRSLNEALL
jgi:hypothetical protein